MTWSSCFFFFFQAEDGIRDHCVTGVQTCALPICSYEPFSEDPFTAGEMVAATVRGLEGDDVGSQEKVAATVKHFTGYSAPDSGRDRENATLTERELRDEHLPSFIRGIDAGAQTVMINSGAVNGEPVHASP